MPESAIKGSAFAGVIEDVQKLLAEGEVSPEELGERLPESDVALIDETISPGFWYPLTAYDRLLALLVDLEGGDDPRGYLRGRGERAMQRLMDLGIYNQFASLEKGWTRLSARVLGTIGQVVYNFLTFEIVPSREEDGPIGETSERFTILVKDGGQLSTNAQTTIEGAVAALASRAAHGPVTVSSARVATDEVEIYVERAAGE
jgi:hypothetical protein